MYDLGLAAATEGLAAANAVAGAEVEKEAVAAKAAMEAARSAAAKAAEKAEMAAAAMVMAAAKPPLTLAVPPQPLTHTVQSDGLIRTGSNASNVSAAAAGTTSSGNNNASLLNNASSSLPHHWQLPTRKERKSAIRTLRRHGVPLTAPLPSEVIAPIPSARTLSGYHGVYPEEALTDRKSGMSIQRFDARVHKRSVGSYKTAYEAGVAVAKHLRLQAAMDVVTLAAWDPGTNLVSDSCGGEGEGRCEGGGRGSEEGGEAERGGGGGKGEGGRHRDGM